MTPRDYQADALAKIKWCLGQNLEGNDLVVLPTGAGKSIVIAHLANYLQEPLLILQPTKEILEQNLGKLMQYVDRAEIGVYSASMDEKRVGKYTFATIQSIYKNPEEFKHFKLVIIDEAHSLNPKAIGMYMTFLKAIGHPKVIGFTATPYRMDSMYINWGTEFVKVITTIKLINRMKGFFWKRILYNINTSTLVEKGYLCPLTYIDKSVIEHAEIPVNKSESDFDLDGYEKKISKKTREILDAIKYAEEIGKSVLVFCSSVSQAKKLSELVPGSLHVTGKTGKKDRELIINSFKNGLTKTVFNVGVLTTGFDHPALDCIVLLRPTRSIALYYQMLGRGVRTFPGKTTCHVIDMTSTVKNMGKVETIALVRRDKWELESQTESGISSWHGAQLYQYLIPKN